MCNGENGPPGFQDAVCASLLFCVLYPYTHTRLHESGHCGIKKAGEGGMQLIECLPVDSSGGEKRKWKLLN